jgi:LacI family transcriptional regulator
MGRRVTSQDVAKHAGVSRTTVSFVLNNIEGVQISAETRERVVKAAQDLGYVPDATAQSLASGRTKTIGLVLNRAPHHIATDVYITQILDVLVEEVRKVGMRLLLEIVEETHPIEAYLDLVDSKRIDGVLFSGPRTDDQALQTLLEKGFPTVLMGDLPNSDFFTVDIDNRAAAYQAAEYLVSLGHRRIGMITNAAAHYTASRERLEGYKTALAHHQINCPENLIRFGDFTPESGHQQMLSLLSEPERPTAVFVASDAVAMGALAAIHEHGLRVPTDISLVGFDDVPLAQYLDPPLTTIHLPAQSMARLACQMLMELIQGHTPEEKQILLNTDLIIRKSCVSLQ